MARTSMIDHPHMKQAIKIISQKSLLTLSQSVGWFLAFFVSLLSYLFIKDGLVFQQSLFISFSVGMIFLWSFRSCSYFVATLLTLIFAVNTGIASIEIILRGFYDKAYFLYLGFAAFSCVFIESGKLLQRFVPSFIRTCQSYQNRFYIGIIFFATFLTIFIPSIEVRLKLMTIFIKKIAQHLQKDTHDPFIQQLYTVAFYGCDGTQHVFFTGSVINFLAFGIFSVYSYDEFLIANWFQGCLIYFFITFIATILIPIFKFYSIKTSIDPNLPYIPEDSHLIFEEKMTIFNFFIAVLFLSFFVFFEFGIAQIAFFFFIMMYSLQLFTIKKWSNIVHWKRLLLFLSLISLSAIFENTNVDNIILDFFEYTEMKSFFMIHKEYFLSSLIMASIILRLILPSECVLAILANIAIPLSRELNISIWIVTFVILVGSNIWFFMYQHKTYGHYVRKNFDASWSKKHIFPCNLLFNVAKIIGLLLSFPYWKYQQLT
jgi:DASS family divalent anion:Na+ symporter